MRPLYKRVSDLLWRAVLTGIVLLAIYSAGMRALLAELTRFEMSMVAYLEQTLQLEIDLASVRGVLKGFSPHIQLDQLQIHVADQGPGRAPLLLKSADIEVDLWASLIAREVRLRHLHVEGLQTILEPFPIATSDARAPFSVAGLLQNIETLTLNNAQVLVRGANHHSLSFRGSAVLLRNGSERQLKLRVRSDTGLSLSVVGGGIGNIFDPESFRGEFHGQIDVATLQPLLAMTDLHGQGSGQFSFWYQVSSDGPAVTLSVAMDSPELFLEQNPSIRFDRISGDFQARPEAQGWRIYGQELHAAANDRAFSINRLLLELKDHAVRVQTADVAIGPLMELLLGSRLLAGEVNDVLSTLAPSGQINAMQASIADFKAPFEAWDLSAHVTDASTQPIAGVPGLLGIDASIEATEAGAVAWIDTDDFNLVLPRVYQDSLAFEQVEGRLAAVWTEHALYLQEGVFRATAADHSADVLFGIDIPLSDLSPETPELAMYLGVTFDELSLATRRYYLPYTINPALAGWLQDAIGSGRGAAGTFLWRGGFRDFGAGSQSLQLGLEARDIELQFQSDWPPLLAPEVTLLVDTERVTGWSDAGQIGDVGLSGINVVVDAHSTTTQLQLSATADADAEHVLDLLRQSPVGKRAETLLADLSGSGGVTAQVDIELDLTREITSPNTHIAAQLDDVRLVSSALKHSLDGITGALSFNSDHGFVSSEIHGQLLGSPVSIEIGAGTTSLGDADIFDGRFIVSLSDSQLYRGLRDFKPEQGFEFWPISGSTEFNVDVAVGEDSTIRVNTALEGMAIALPAPLGKLAPESTPLEIRVNPGAPDRVDVDWAERFVASMSGEDGDWSYLDVRMTPTALSNIAGDSTEKSGLVLRGVIDQLDLRAWYPVTESLGWPRGNSTMNMPLTVDGLRINTLTYGDTHLGSTLLSKTRQGGWDMWRARTEWADATLAVPLGIDQTTLIINELNLSELPALTSSGSAEGWHPPKLAAPMTVVIANMQLKDENLGAARFELSSGDDALSITEIAGNVIDIDLLEGSALTWNIDANGVDYSVLNLNARLDNVGRTLAALGQAPIAETNDGQLTATLRWPGAPSEVRANSLTGHMDLLLREGSFLPVPAGATGFVRLLSVLNLVGLFERANVSRLFDPGVAFKTAQGQVLFDVGQLTLPDFQVEGPGGGFQFSSEIDLVERYIDGELVVTLPLAGNLPWVVALAGGLPIAAGAYIASKVFEDEVKTLSSGVYSVTGNVDAPEVKFVRVFDAELSKKPVVKTTADQSVGSEDEKPADTSESGVPGEDSSSSLR